ncbi:MAG: carbonic anhydrase [Candidatus Nitrosopumilus sp. metabat.KBP569_Feb_25m_nospike.7]
MKSKISLLIEQNNSKIILVSAHHDCEGNLISKDNQVSQIKHAVYTIRSWGLTATVIGICVNEQLQVEVIEK